MSSFIIHNKKFTIVPIIMYKTYKFTSDRRYNLRYSIPNYNRNMQFIFQNVIKSYIKYDVVNFTFIQYLSTVL